MILSMMGCKSCLLSLVSSSISCIIFFERKIYLVSSILSRSNIVLDGLKLKELNNSYDMLDSVNLAIIQVYLMQFTLVTSMAQELFPSFMVNVWAISLI